MSFNQFDSDNIMSDNAIITFLETQKQQGNISEFVMLNKPFRKFIHLGDWVASTPEVALIVKSYSPFINKTTGEITQYFDLYKMPIELAKETLANSVSNLVS
jgi:hypothetical protein